MYAVMDKKMPIAAKEALKNLGCTLIESVKIPSLYPAIESHPDIQLCQVDAHTFVAAPEVYSYYSRRLAGCKVLKGDTFLKGTYPLDIAYNVTIFENKVWHHPSNTDPVILRECATRGMEFIPVAQGYARCNMALISGGVITSDPSIYQASLLAHVDCLKIEEDPFVILEGFSHGFLGGACGFIKKNFTLTVCGDITRHKNYSDILAFCQKHHTKILSLCTGHILDIGSILYF